MLLNAEVAIIGAGPIGIELAIALKKNDISCIQFDKGQVGQIIFNYPYQTHFFSSSERIAIAGIPIQTLDQQKCSREEYLAYLRTCILEYQLQINTFVEVVGVKKNDHEGTFEIETLSAMGKKSFKTSFVIFSTGGTARSRMLNIPGENLPHVSTKLEDPHLYFQKNIAIIGSRNSAVEWALRCYHAYAKVTLISRRELFDTEHVKYWLLPELKGLVKEGKINCIFSNNVSEIMPGKVSLKALAGTLTKVDADFVLKAIGFEADVSLLKNLGINIFENDIPSFNEISMESNIENAFVIGTATGGTQLRYKVFIENCHDHVHKVVESIGKKLKKDVKVFKKDISTILPEQ